MSRVSVIIPIYNVEKWIEQCIDSIAAQTYRNIEVILIDDGSTDNCGKICDDYAKKDNRIKVIHNKNLGVSCSRNNGIRVATGEYIMFIDSDDFICDNHAIEKFLKVFKENKCDFIYTSYCRFNDDNSKSIVEVLPLNINSCDLDKLKGKETLEVLIKNNSFHHAPYLKICKREYILKNNLYFKEGFYHEDVEWSEKLFYYADKISIYYEPWYMRRMRENSIITTKDDKVATQKVCNRIIIIKELIEFYIKNNENPYDSIIINDLVKMYWGDIMVISLRIKNKVNVNQCIEVVNSTKDIIKYSNNIKHIIIRNIFKVIGVKNTIAILRGIGRRVL